MHKIGTCNERGGTRGYRTPRDRKLGVAMLRKQGYNYFVFFHEVTSRFALQYGKATWVQPGGVYICR